MQKKANKDVIEPFSVRIEKVRTFLQFFKPGLEYDIVSINDVYGPTGWDPDIQALVTSQETLDGAKLGVPFFSQNVLRLPDIHFPVAAHRASHSLPPLQLFVIDVISSTSSYLENGDTEWLKQNKLSSTYIREWIVAQRRDVQV